MLFAFCCVGGSALADADKPAFWSFQPIESKAVPAATADSGDHPVDRFIVATLSEKGLALSAEAERRTLYRRVYFDLVGLPPAPEELAALLAEPDPLAYEKLVDRLLASPGYGERWARHWLDVAHYGDTHGYDKDKIRENAWPYRDYVIRALNEDKPYDRFITEQIAGDVAYPDTVDGVVALGFLAAGPWDFVGQVEVKDGTTEKARVRNIDRDDMVATTMNTFVSLTAQCARCHDHKFDPVSQEDYYSLQAVFAAVDRSERMAPASPAGPAFPVYAATARFSPLGQFTPTGGTPRAIHVLSRGDEAAPKKKVSPGTVGAIASLPSRFNLPPAAGEADARKALADWVVDANNPLTWRSIVNRVWYHHFGRGIVETVNDFGRMGAAPTHPELLDWLAADFRDNGRSLKRLHRLIVTSKTYRQSSGDNPAFAKIDASNQFLWRQNRRRLDVEAIRDTSLSVAGLLDRKMGGPGFKTFGFESDESPRYKYADFDPDDPASHRRSIYRMIVRSAPDPFMETLDCADPTVAVDRRNETLTALQALALLNNRFVIRTAERFAERLKKESTDPAVQVSQAYELALGRPPSKGESDTLIALSNEHGLANACRLIFNTNEFSFVD